MKKLLLLLIIFIGLAIRSVNAQSYLNLRSSYFGFGASYPLGLVATGGRYNQNGWGGTITINPMWFSASNAPADYHGGGFSSTNNISDLTLLAAIRVLKEWPTNSKYFKFGAEAGLGLVHTSIADNFRERPGWNLFASNYIFDRVKENSIGISLRGKLEWRIGDWSGLEIGGNANFSKAKPYFGLDLMCTFGEYKKR